MVPDTGSGPRVTERPLEWVRAMVRSAVSAAVTTFHAGNGPAAPLRARTIVQELRERPVTRASIVLPVPTDLPRRNREPDGASLFDVGAVGPIDPVELHLEVPLEEVARADARALAFGLRTAVERGRARSWGLGHGARAPSPEGVQRWLALGPDWVRLPLHLLSTPDARSAVAEAARLDVPVVVDDPFAAGALNGRLLREGRVAPPGAVGPMDLARVRSEWGPVVALGFLTADRDRTLGQAALQFALGTPGVVTVLTDAPDAAEFVALARLGEVPPLSAELRRRVEAGMERLPLSSQRGRPPRAADARVK